MSNETTGRLAALRAEMARAGLEGFIVPHADSHQNEELPAAARRLAWLTGFTGSAGLAVVLDDRAAIFVDGRYTLQVRQQVDGALFSFHHLTGEPPGRWLAAHAAGLTVGFDPWLHSKAQLDGLRRACAPAGIRLTPVTANPLDVAWSDRPPRPETPIRPHPLRYSGQAAGEKRASLAAGLAERHIAATVLTRPDSIAWLLNIRAGDVPHNPLPLSFAILHADSQVTLFAEPARVDAETRAHLGNGVELVSPDGFAARLAALGDRRVVLDPDATPAWVFDRLAGADIVTGTDPCQLPKAIRNKTELAGVRAAHRRDGKAVTRFLAWLDDSARKPGLTESVAAETLATLRAETAAQDPAGDLYRGASFATIAGSGPNGAIVHYRVTEATDRVLGQGELFLVDSGAQYLDGTTDVTRTVAIGTPDSEMRDRYTRVLRGHIALARQRFPEGTCGRDLDSLARQFLWQAGLDYDHGTGHGVGSYLGVHEGPQRIARRGGDTPLQPGMILSNEPGYYKTGAFGIRIENLVAVVRISGPADREHPLLGFETLTLVPLDRRLIETGQMTASDIAWVDRYHRRVREALAPDLDNRTRVWLVAATAPLGQAAGG